MNFKLILPLIAATWLCGCASPETFHGVPHFIVVDQHVIRGGQPTAEGWKTLHNLGVTVDIKLNTEAEGSDKAFNNVLMHSEYDYSITFWEQLVGPPKWKVDDAVNQMADHPAGVYVHCGSDSRTSNPIARWLFGPGGSDRTGLIVAIYRMRVDHWTKEDARKEMLANGFHRSLIGLDWYWRTQVK